MEKDFGLRFTDEVYATKDDVKKALNMSSIDSIWDKVMIFRAYYTRQIELQNIERVPFSFVLTPKFNSKVINVEKKLSKLLIKFSLELYSNNESAVLQRNLFYFNILNSLSSIYEININEETINAMLNNNIETLPVEYLFLNRYLECLKFIEKKNNGSVNVSLILSLYCKLRGIEFDVNNIDGYYRKTELLDKNDHVLMGKHYEASPVDRIKDLMENLCLFLTNSNLFSTCKAIACYFFINYIKPFEYYNEEMAILLFKYIMAKEDFDQIPCFINVEKLLSKEFENEIASLLKESEMRLDLTYIANYFTDFLLMELTNFDDLDSSFDNSAIYSENFNKAENYIKNNITIKENNEIKEEINVNHENDIQNLNGINYKQNISLPVLPVGLDQKDAEIVALNLLEIYPSMKKNQAEFYSRHCTIGKYYTISQYKKEQNVAYETARTSMDNLVNLGFYKKEQIKNKFVYTPVVK